MNERDEDPARAVQAAEVPLPMLMTVKEALALLPCGKHWLLAHLRAWPLYHGKPTHRFAGRSIVFTPDDFRNLLESFPTRNHGDTSRRPFQPRPEPEPPPAPAAPASREPNAPKKHGRRGKRNYTGRRPEAV